VLVIILAFVIIFFGFVLVVLLVLISVARDLGQGGPVRTDLDG